MCCIIDRSFSTVTLVLDLFLLHTFLFRVLTSLRSIDYKCLLRSINEEQLQLKAYPTSFENEYCFVSLEKATKAYRSRTQTQIVIKELLITFILRSLELIFAKIVMRNRHQKSIDRRSRWRSHIIATIELHFKTRLSCMKSSWSRF